jgi:hypothetical protein
MNSIGTKFATRYKKLNPKEYENNRNVFDTVGKHQFVCAGHSKSGAAQAYGHEHEH